MAHEIQLIKSLDEVEVGMCLKTTRTDLRAYYLVTSMTEKRTFDLTGTKFVCTKLEFINGGASVVDHISLSRSSFKYGFQYYSVDPDAVKKMIKAVHVCNSVMTAGRESIEREIKLFDKQQKVQNN